MSGEDLPLMSGIESGNTDRESVPPTYWLFVCNGGIAGFKFLTALSTDDVMHILEQFPILILPEFVSIFNAFEATAEDSELKERWANRVALLAELQSFLREEAPEEYAYKLMICGEELAKEWRVNRTVNLLRALDLFRQARSFLAPESSEFAISLMHEGTVYSKLADLGLNPRDHLEQALRLYDQARKLLPTHDSAFASLLINEGGARAQLSVLGVDVRSNLEVALEMFDEACSLLPQESDEYLSSLQNKGIVYMSLADLGLDRRRNLDEAVRVFRQASFVAPRDTHALGQCLKSEGSAREKLAELGVEPQMNIEESVSLYERARALFSPKSPSFALSLMDEGNSRKTLAWMGIKARENFEEAIRLIQEARSIFSPPEPYSRDTCSFANSLYNEAGARQGLAELGVMVHENLAEARRLYRESADLLRQSGFNLDAIKAYRGLASIAEREKDWEAARIAVEQAIHVLEEAGVSATLVRDKHAWMEIHMEFYKAMIEVCLHLGRDTDAAQFVERGRSRALVELLHLQELQPLSIPPDQVETYRRMRGRAEEIAALLSSMRPGAQIKDEEEHKQRLPSLIQERVAIFRSLRSLEAELRHADPNFFALAQPLSLSDMTELARELGRPLVLIWVGPERGVVFLIGTLGELDRLILPHLTDTAVRQWLVEPSSKDAPHGWIGSYRQLRERKINREDWMEQMLPVLDRVSKELMEPIRLWLKARGEKRAALVVGGPLGLLPLHAARCREGNQTHYFIEEIETVYAPSAWVLKRCLERERRQWMPMLAIADPPQKEMLRLPFGEWEVEQIAALVEMKCGTGTMSSLVGTNATLETTVELLPKHAVVHFACHAKSDLEQPLQSSLMLTGGNLTLARLLGQMQRDTASLVVLSACESGIGYVPDSSCEEYLGLPAGFIVAGAKTVVGSLWAVFDPPTALLMVKMYEHLLVGMGVSAALREAQLWLMTLSREEAISLVALPIETVSARLPQRLTENYRVWISQLAERPFAHPYYWAAFQAYGSPEPVF